MSALDSLDVLEYRVSQLERMLEPLMRLVNDLDRKIALLAQKIVIATIIVGALVNGLGVWYSANAGKDYSEPEKTAAHYESRVSNSEKIKELEAQLDRLKKTSK